MSSKHDQVTSMTFVRSTFVKRNTREKVRHWKIKRYEGYVSHFDSKYDRQNLSQQGCDNDLLRRYRPKH
eukprot:1674307-Ditylum_brightwellii.AAC.1